MSGTLKRQGNKASVDLTAYLFLRNQIGISESESIYWQAGQAPVPQAGAGAALDSEEVSLVAKFFWLLLLKSVSYQPPPPKRKAAAVIFLPKLAVWQ